MKKLVPVVMAAFIVLLSVFFVSAHPGKTDSDGGHYNNDTGEYHYHHGYPEHSHTNGECPYEFDDKTDHNSSGNSSTTTNPTLKSTIEQTTKAAAKTSTKNDNYSKAIINILAVALICCAIYILYQYNNLNKEKANNLLLNRKLKEANSKLSIATQTIDNKNKDIDDLKKAIHDKDNEIELIVSSNVSATEKIEQYFFEHTGKKISPLNPRPERLEIYADNLLFRVSSILSKGNITFTNIVTQNEKVSYSYSVHLSVFSDKVCDKYKEKAYNTHFFDDESDTHKYGFERYFLAENENKTLLVQCVYLESKYSLNIKSVYALYSTYYKLQKNFDKKISPVLICSSSIDDESKNLMQALNINFKENAIS